MKYLVLPLLFISSVALANGGNANSSCNQTTSENALSRLLLANTAPTESKDTGEAERSGCCSHHSGVCGCSNGRAVCCDSTLSPTCGCN